MNKFIRHLLWAGVVLVSMAMIADTITAIWGQQ